MFCINRQRFSGSAISASPTSLPRLRAPFRGGQYRGEYAAVTTKTLGEIFDQQAIFLLYMCTWLRVKIFCYDYVIAIRKTVSVALL